MQRFTTFLILLAAGMLLSACNTAAEITFTPTISPGLTLTPSHTQTPTQMPSATASPSRQPSATATANATASPTPTHTERTAYPTATPFVPTIQADAT